MYLEAQIVKNRRSILLMLFIGYTIASMDRFFINYAILPIAGDLQLNASQTGMILSAFFLGYALMQMPGGWFADRIGPRITIIACIVSWSIFTGLTGLAWSLAAMLVIRFIFGLGEGGFIPASAKMITDSYPQENRSRAMSILLTAAAFAGVLTPIMSTLLITSIGWRQLFYIFGFVGALLAILFWFFLKPKYVNQRDGSAVPALTKEERELAKKNAVPLNVLLKTPMLWSLLIASFAVFSVNWGTASWIPTYLVNVRGLDFNTLGLVAMVPAATSIAFMLIAGVLVDKVFVGKEKLLGIICGLGVTVLVFLMFNSTSITAFITFQSLLPIFMGTGIVLVTTLPMKKLPESVGGSAVGMVQFGGQFAGFIAPLAIGFLVDGFGGSYTGAIWMLVGLGIVFAVAVSTVSFKKGAIFNKDQTVDIPLQELSSEQAPI